MGARVTERMTGGWLSLVVPSPVASVEDESRLQAVNPMTASETIPTKICMTRTKYFDMKPHNLCAPPDRQCAEVYFCLINPAD
jgi:hypothetical protein